MAFPEARQTHNLCRQFLYGDVHQLGTAAIFAMGFIIVGGYKTVAGVIVLLASILNVGLVYSITQRVFKTRVASLSAGLLTALHPAVIRMAGATQTETFNDTFLLISVLLVIWDVERASSPTGQGGGWVSRLAASPFSRAFFVSFAANIRPELLVLAPLVLGSSLWASKGRRRALVFVTLFLLSSVPLLIPALAAVKLKSGDPVPLVTQLDFGLNHVENIVTMVLPPAGAIALLVVLATAERRAWLERRSALVYLLLALGFLATYLVSQGLILHVVRESLHIVYHGTIFFWPVFGFAISRLVEGTLTRRWITSRKVAELTGFSVTVALCVIIFFSTTIQLSISLLNPQISLHRSVAEAIPKNTDVFLISARIYVNSSVTAVLYSEGLGSVTATSMSEVSSPDQLCWHACRTVESSLMSNRRLVFVNLSNDNSREEFPEDVFSGFMSACGIEGEVEKFEGFHLLTVSKSCRNKSIKTVRMASTPRSRWSQCRPTVSRERQL
jgi:hypothetical protein